MNLLRASYKKYQIYYCITLGTLMMAFFWLIRLDGINCDEGGYLSLAATDPLGDMTMTGKPPLFYFLNYLVFHIFPNGFSHFQAAKMQFFYLLPLVTTTALLASRFARLLKTTDILPIFLVLLLNPLMFYHATHFMMESAIILGLNLILIGILDLMDSPSQQKQILIEVLIFLCCVFLVTLKETTASPLLILGLTCFFGKLKASRSLLAGLVLGVISRFAMSHYLHSPPLAAGLVVPVSNYEALVKYFLRMPDYFKAWLFFVWPPIIAGACWNYSKQTLPHPLKKGLFVLALLTVLAMFGIESLGSASVMRYVFPTLWLGLVAVAFLAVSGTKKLRWLIAASSIVFIVSFQLPGTQKMGIWPDVFADEMLRSGGTSFVGIPIFRWSITTFANPFRTACLHYSTRDTEWPDFMIRNLSGFFYSLQFFDENHTAEFNSCQGQKIFVDRSYSTPPGLCQLDCPPTSVSVCSTQTIVSFNVHKYTKDWPGLLSSGACVY